MADDAHSKNAPAGRPRDYIPARNAAWAGTPHDLRDAARGVLVHVDGQLSALDLGLMTGLNDAVWAALAELETAGAILPRPAPGRSPSPPAVAPVVEPEIEPAAAERIDTLFASLGSRTHYELLGVHETANRKEIKAAYFALAPTFHPDRFFRKQLGPFREKLEAIFRAFTTAHDVLTTFEERSAYDAYLRTRQSTEQLERALEEPVVGDDEIVASAAAPVSSTKVATPVIPDADVAQARRRALAAKLRGGRPTSRIANAPPSSRRIVVSHPQEAQRRRVQQYETVAKAAVARGDSAGAARAYGLASVLAPTDVALRAARAEWSQKAAVELGVMYARQGEYEAKQGLYREASDSFARAGSHIPDDAVVLHMAAMSFIEAEKPAAKAIELLRRAVALAPDVIRYRTSLADTYLRAGQHAAAKRELEAAAKIDANDEKLRALMKRVP